MNEITVIKQDLFDIVWQVENLGNYLVVYNHKRNLYEVRERHTLNLCVSLYDRLDQRSVRKVRQTRRENIDKLIDSIEESNAKLLAEKFL